MIQVNTNKVNGLITMSGLTQGIVAEKIGISESTLNLKLNNKRRIYMEEVGKLCLLLNIRTPSLLKECFGLSFLHLPESRENATNEIGGDA